MNSYLEGSAKTTLLNAKVNLFGARDNLKTSINNAIADGKTTPAEKADVDSKFATFNARLKDFQNAVEDANKAIQTKLDSISTDKVNNLQIGGRNILRNTSNFTTANYWAGASIVTEDGKKCLYREYFGTVESYIQQNFYGGALKRNTNYTLSFMCKTLGHWQEVYILGGAILRSVFESPDGFTKQVFKFNTGNADQTYVRFDINGAGVDVKSAIWLYDIKLEEGEKDTAWTPSIEDTQAEIEKAKSDAIDSQAAYVYRGAYSASAIYIGNEFRLDAVKYNNIYYRAKRTAGQFFGQTPSESSDYWEVYGAQFESVATNTILAEGASIGDWSIEGGKIVSTLGTGNKISLDANGAKVQIESSTSGGDYSMQTGLGSKITLDANGGDVEVRAKNPPSYSTGTSYMSPTGIFANLAGTNAMPASSGYTHRGAIVGLGFANVAKNEWTTNVVDTIIAGVYGRAANSGTAPAYGGFFYDLYAGGLTLGRKAITTLSSSTYLTSGDTLVVGYTSNGAQIVYLPPSPKEGQIVFFRQWWTGSMRVYPRTGQLIYDDHTENSYFDVTEGQMMIAVFTIGYVNSVKKEAWLINKFKY